MWVRGSYLSVALAVFSIMAASTARADYNSAVAAYKEGDYATALAEYSQETINYLPVRERVPSSAQSNEKRFSIRYSM